MMARNEFWQTHKRKIVWGVLFLLLILAGVWWWTHRTTESKESYVLGQVTTGSIASSIDATGAIEPVNEVKLSANISGTLTQVFVKENQQVHEGDVLAVISAKSAESQLSQAESILANKRSLYDRYRQLYAEGAISYQQLADAQMNYETAQATYNKAQADMSDTTIVAPMDGVVIGEPMKVGETVAQGLSSQMIIAKIADLSSMRIRLLVDETDIGQIKTGQNVTFTVDAYPNRKFHGHVTDISRTPASSGNSSSTAVIYYTVYVAINNDEISALYPSMTARAIIDAQTKDHVVLVPITALRSDVNGQYVYKKAGDKLGKTPVVIGIITDTQAEVISGLSAEDTIVTSGSVKEDKAGNSVTRQPRI